MFIVNIVAFNSSLLVPLLAIYVVLLFPFGLMGFIFGSLISFLGLTIYPTKDDDKILYWLSFPGAVLVPVVVLLIGVLSIACTLLAPWLPIVVQFVLLFLPFMIYPG